MLTSNAVNSSRFDKPNCKSSVWEALSDAAPRLVDSLVHEARNPLNALSINLEVLSEKIRNSPVLPSAEKNLRAMREQIFRVDEILRRFADFIAPRLSGEGDVNFSDLLKDAIAVAGHEASKKRLSLVSQIEPNLVVRLPQAWAGHFFALQPLLRAIGRSEPGSAVQVSLKQENGDVVLFVADSGSEKGGPADLTSAIEELCRQNGGVLSVCGTGCRLAFPAIRRA